MFRSCQEWKVNSLQGMSGRVGVVGGQRDLLFRWFVGLAGREGSGCAVVVTEYLRIKKPCKLCLQGVSGCVRVVGGRRGL